MIVNCMHMQAHASNGLTTIIYLRIQRKKKQPNNSPIQVRAGFSWSDILHSPATAQRESLTHMLHRKSIQDLFSRATRVSLYQPLMNTFKCQKFTEKLMQSKTSVFVDSCINLWNMYKYLFTFNVFLKSSQANIIVFIQLYTLPRQNGVVIYKATNQRHIEHLYLVYIIRTDGIDGIRRLIILTQTL